ncbi:MAG TPA: hypothetical protein VGS17_03680 [Candidatus Limnocylindria bacterium]|nr:hypothetical protein [Candidatus Limnocylindria bacterium]
MMSIGSISGAIFVPLAALGIVIDALMIHTAPAPAAPRRDEHAPKDMKRAA